MPKGAASKDKKSAEKKGGNKGKGKSAEEPADKGGKVRTCHAISIQDSFFFCANRRCFRVKAG